MDLSARTVSCTLINLHDLILFLEFYYIIILHMDVLALAIHTR